MQAAYELHYNSACDHVNFIVESMLEQPGKVIGLTIQAGGEEAIQALFDAVLDQGHRLALVKLLDSPALPMGVRERLETFLYGRSRQQAALFKTLH